MRFLLRLEEVLTFVIVSEFVTTLLAWLRARWAEAKNLEELFRSRRPPPAV